MMTRKNVIGGRDDEYRTDEDSFAAKICRVLSTYIRGRNRKRNKCWTDRGQIAPAPVGWQIYIHARTCHVILRERRGNVIE